MNSLPLLVSPTPSPTTGDEVQSATSKESPYLPSDIDVIADFLKTKFNLIHGALTLKSEVVEVVVECFGKHVTATTVGRAVSKAFGSSKVNNRGRRLKDAYTNLRKIQASGACSHPSEALLITRIPQRVPGASFQSSEQLRSTQTSVASRIPRRKAECLDTSRSSETPIKIPKTKTPSAREHKAPAHLKDYVVVKSKQVVRSIPAPKTKASGSQTVVSEMTVTSSKPREKAIGGAYPYNVSMSVSVDEAIHIAKLRSDDTGTIRHMAGSNLLQCLQISVEEYIQELIHKELQSYAKVDNCMMKKSSARDMESFNLQTCWDQFEKHIPTLTHIILSICTSQQRRMIKTPEYLVPAITTLLGKCLGIYSDNFSALRTYYSLILSNGGLTDATMNRLARMYDCVTHQNIIKKLSAMAERYDASMKTWKEFNIVLDNVDIYVKPRREASNRSNTMHHMVQAIAVKDRVLTTKTNENRQPMVDIENLQPSHVYPTANDRKAVEQLMCDKIIDVLVEMPAVAKLGISIDHSHQHSAEMKQKSELANLGVLQKNENIKEELLACLQTYHNLIPKKDGELEYKFCIGDYLTFERGQQVLHTQSDGVTQSERLEGLLIAMADFHVQMNFLKMAYRILFKGDSQPSTGSLANAKDYLNARNVTANPAAKYYDCAALFDKLFHAYIFLAAVKELGLKSFDDVDINLTEKDVRSAAMNIVNKYTDIAVPDLSETGKLRCRHCQKKYSTQKNLLKHHQLCHQDVAISNVSDDAVYNYTSMFITLGLFRAVHNQAIQMGNGETVLLLYKYMFIMFKANGCYKYGCGLLETIVQTQVLPKYLSYRLIWNRFHNSYNAPNTNIALDLKLEHENRLFKDRLKSYRGKFTDTHLDRISKGRGVLSKIIENLDKHLGYHSQSGRSKDGLPMLDIKLLMTKMGEDNLLSIAGRRTHSPSLLSTPSTPIAAINGKSLREWMASRLEMCRVRHYYRQFLSVPSSFTSELDSNISLYPYLTTDWADMPI